MSDVALCVVVIAYNEEAYVGQALASLAQQGEPGIEVIVVDSNSSDATERIACQAGDALESFRYHQLPAALGPAYGRNRGAELADCERLLFLDADTVLPPGFLSRTCREIRKHGVDVATCPLRPLEPSLAGNLGSAFLNGFMRVLRPVYPSAYGACLFSSRTLHQAVGGFDETLAICEDCHYVKKALGEGFRFRILHTAFFTSDRRARRDGNLRLLATYIRCHMRRMLTGREIHRERLQYTYGDY